MQLGLCEVIIYCKKKNGWKILICISILQVDQH